MLASIIVPFASVYAASESEDGQKEILREQIAALTRHIERLQFDITAPAGGEVQPLTSRAIESIIADGVSWLKAAQEKSGDRAGRFRYEYRPYTGTYSSDDNIVRQAGTFYQVSEVARLTDAGTYELEDALVRSADFFSSLSRTGSYNERSFRCVVRYEGSDECKLGATSLVLVGLLNLVEAYPEYKSTYRDLIHDYAAFIMAMRNKEAGFRNRFYVDQELQSSRESSFSNGEAMLALVRYYRLYEDAEVKETLEDVFAYIASDKVAFDSPLYLWAMAALRDMHELWPDEAYVSYAKRYTDWRTRGFQHRKGTDHNMCSYVEGVAHARALLKDHISVSEHLQLIEEIDFWLKKTQALQIRRDERFRVFADEEGRLSIKKLAEPARAHGGFLTASTEPTQRIDYTQHCLNAYLLQLIHKEGKTEDVS